MLDIQDKEDKEDKEDKHYSPVAYRKFEVGILGVLGGCVWPFIRLSPPP